MIGDYLLIHDLANSQQFRKIIMGTNQHLRTKLIMEYASRFREVCNDLVDNGYLPVIAKEDALDVITKEYLENNPDVEYEITCQVFFAIGDLSNIMEFKPRIHKQRFNVEDLFREANENKTDENK